MGWVVNATPRPLYPRERERDGTNCLGGWVGSSASLEGCGKSRPTGIRSSYRPASSVVTIQTGLSRPQNFRYTCSYWSVKIFSNFNKKFIQDDNSIQDDNLIQADNLIRQYKNPLILKKRFYLCVFSPTPASSVIAGKQIQRKKRT